MTYEKPMLVPLDSAINLVCSTGKSDPNNFDTYPSHKTVMAYEADE